MTKKSNMPSHRVYAVTNDGKQTFWREIGAVWPHSDGEGFSMKLDFLPLNSADFVIRKLKAETPEESEASFETA
jgi:hypothetical protein